MKPAIQFLSIVFILMIAACPIQAASPVPDGWTSDLAAAKAVASKKDQKMLLLFTGSDWCIWCKRLKAEILATDTFEKWASENVVRVFLDYPRTDYRSPEVRTQNDGLAKAYGIRGYPTVVVANADGEELARLGYMQGGPKTFIRAIEQAGH